MQVGETPKPKKGRPINSRNRSTLLKSQLKLDDLSLVATGTLKALMTNDKLALGLSEKDNVPLSIRLAAAKEALNKAIANEKEKELRKLVEVPKEDVKPLAIFSAVAVKL